MLLCNVVVCSQQKLFFASLVVGGMVKTRSGRDVFYTEASYGRAAWEETSRQRQKRKLSNKTSVQGEATISRTATPPRRRTRGQIQWEEDLATLPSALRHVGATPPSKVASWNIGRGTRQGTTSWIPDNSLGCWNHHTLARLNMWSPIHSLLSNKCNSKVIFPGWWQTSWFCEGLK